MSYAKARDQRIADEVTIDRTLMCTAAGCPNRWSCDVGRGRLCSWHDRTEPHLWPRITQEQLDAEAERALRNASPPAPPPRVDVRAARAKLRDLVPLIGKRSGGREWAVALARRDQAGDSLTPAQRGMYRDALRGHELLDQAVAGAAIPEQRITAALVATGDLPSVNARRRGDEWDECPAPFEIPASAYDAAEAQG